VKTFTKDELAARLKPLDEELKAQGIPLRFRPLECFKKLYGPLPDGDVRKKLFDSVTMWFLDCYGERVQWDQVLGRIPVLVRGELYLVDIPFVGEDAVVKLTDRIQGLSKEIAESFSQEEFSELAAKVAAAAEALNKLYTLHVDDHILDETERGMIRRAFYDFEHTATSLKQTGDTQNAIFHSHAAAEKFLKVALKRAGGVDKLKNLRHDLPKIFRRLVEIHKAFKWLESAVMTLQASAPSMEIRYSDVARTMQNAVTSHNAAMNICGTLAGIWLFEVARGPKECKFVPGQFYIDGARRTYRCSHLLHPDKACLTLFAYTPLHGFVMADIVIDSLYSNLYLQVIEDQEIHALQVKYDLHMKNRGRPVTPEEFGVKVVSGPEGSYATAFRTVEIDIHRDKLK
jgi:HEPN domain-containing protein